MALKVDDLRGFLIAGAPIRASEAVGGAPGVLVLDFLSCQLPFLKHLRVHGIMGKCVCMQYPGRLGNKHFCLSCGARALSGFGREGATV